MNKVWPLLCSPSPRDIPEVFEALKETGFDRLYAKYFFERHAYGQLRKFFLKHPEYTHMVICPDDLIVKRGHVEALIKDLEKEDYPVLSGMCNVNRGNQSGFWNICHNLPHPTRWVPKRKQVGWRWYGWYHYSEIPLKSKERIIEVPFTGFACEFIRRDVVERIKFIDDRNHNQQPSLFTSSVDVMFANTCMIENVPQYVDTQVRMAHLKEDKLFDIILGDSELRFYGHDSLTNYEIESEMDPDRKVSINVVGKLPTTKRDDVKTHQK